MSIRVIFSKIEIHLYVKAPQRLKLNNLTSPLKEISVTIFGFILHQFFERDNLLYDDDHYWTAHLYRFVLGDIIDDVHKIRLCICTVKKK